MRTTPAPSADRRLPRIRLPGRALLVMWRSFGLAFLGLLRYAGRPTAAPTERGRGPTSRRSRTAVVLAGCRPVAARRDEPRPDPPPSTPAGAGTPPVGRSATTRPARLL